MNDLFDRTDEELVALYAEGNNGALMFCLNDIRSVLSTTFIVL